tara:strand:- start:56 stop:343 length:288 start_codon:yes stop_codon:yes gene_type:complete
MSDQDTTSTLQRENEKLAKRNQYLTALVNNSRELIHYIERAEEHFSGSKSIIDQCLEPDKEMLSRLITRFNHLERRERYYCETIKAMAELLYNEP